MTKRLEGRVSPAAFLCAGSAFVFGARSPTISAAKITAKPAAIRKVTLSPSSRQENATPNTDSRDSRIAACEAGAMLWPMFCRLIARVVEKIARYSRPPIEPALNSSVLPAFKEQVIRRGKHRGKRKLQHDQSVSHRPLLAAFHGDDVRGKEHTAYQREHISLIQPAALAIQRKQPDAQQHHACGRKIGAMQLLPEKHTAAEGHQQNIHRGQKRVFSRRRMLKAPPSG